MPGPDETPGASDRAALLRILSSPWIAQSCYALAKLGIPDLMAAGPRPAAELAASSGVDARVLHRMLRALASAGLMRESAPGWFGLTPVTQLLRSDLPRSSRDAAIMFGEEVFQSFAEITYTLRTGKPAFEKVYGRPFYDYLAANPDAAQTFSAAMGGAGVPAVLSACDLDGVRRIVDVGGGNGGLLSRVLRAHPEASGVLVDLPTAADQARERLAKAGFSGRVEIVAESFFDVMPAGGDVYVLCRVLHNWPDEECAGLLRRIRQAMAPDGRVIVIEDLLPDPAAQGGRQAQPGDQTEPEAQAERERQSGQVMDLLILLMLSGRDRSEAGYRELLGRAGLVVRAVHPPRGRSAESAIEATGGADAVPPPGPGDPRPA
jgi:SAM-dependent methyltransferase